MQINWLGQSCFKIQTKTSNGEITIVTDPFNKDIGLRLPKTDADIVTISCDQKDHNNFKDISGDPFIVNGAGEYEIKSIFVYAINTVNNLIDEKKPTKNTICVIKLIDENITIAHLGDLSDKLANDQLEHMENIDILLIPVGGKHTIDSKKSVEVINQIEPRIVIPMHYNIDGLKIGELDGVEKFCKEMGVDVERQSKLKISKKDLPQEDTKVIILEK